VHAAVSVHSNFMTQLVAAVAVFIDSPYIQAVINFTTVCSLGLCGL